MAALKKHQETAIVSIIQDAIVWHRVTSRMYDLVRAFGNETDFDTDRYYAGFSNAFLVMGIHENMDLCSNLSEIFFKEVEQDANAKDLAQSLYVEWLVCIKNFCLTQNLA